MDQEPRPAILIVDDREENRLALRSVLGSLNLAMDEAADGMAALSKVLANEYAAILMDVQMPEMDGFETARLIRERKRSCLVPILFISASHREEHSMNEGYSAGAVDYLPKPYNPVHLRAKVSVFVDLWRKDQALREANARLLVSQEALARTNMLLQEINLTLEEKVAERTAEVTATTEQLWQAAKLATVGEMTASIAHDLNNPLAIVGLRVEELLAGEEPGSPRHASMKVIEGEVDRLTALVASLLHFSRLGAASISPMNLRDEVTASLDLLGHRMKTGGIQVRVEIPGDLPPVQADRQKIRQVLLNLLTNAIDAMPGGGDLTVTAGRPNGGEKVVLEVRDTGCGIPAKNAAKVLEPFFTTKPEGKGTGLGLPICRRIAREHGGQLEISSAPGQGTAVRVVLPFRHGGAQAA